MEETTAQMIGDALIQADRSASLWINQQYTFWSDGIWKFMSDKVVWIPLYVLVLALMFWRLGWKKTLLSIAAVVLTIICCDQLSSFFKDWVCRLRPSHDPWMLTHGLRIPGGTGGSYGFFSAHAANCFGFAACSSAMLGSDRKHKYGLYAAFIMVWAALVSLSRVFLGLHYLGDILVGAIVGLLFGWLWALVFRRIAHN